MVVEQFPNTANHYYLRWHFKLISNNFFSQKRRGAGHKDFDSCYLWSELP